MFSKVSLTWWVCWYTDFKKRKKMNKKGISCVKNQHFVWDSGVKSCTAKCSNYQILLSQKLLAIETDYDDKSWYLLK